MAGVPVSRSEVDFTLQALRRENIRIDGRALAAYRRFGLRFGAAHGEVEVNFGPTRALAVCSGEVVTPPPERPNEGRITFHVEFGPMASPNFEVGRPSPQANAVANFIERLLKGSHAIDVEALCIVGGQKVWSIRVDVRALDDDGNLGDVCCIAALCSLMHFRKAETVVHGEDAKVFAAEERVPVPLSIHHLPVPVTFALFTSSSGKDAEPSWLLDPNRLEEAAMGGQLSVAVNQHGELCGLHKPGGMAIDIVLINHCISIATARAKELCNRIESELKGDLAKRQEKRRNVHQRYVKADILSVDWAVPTAQESAAPPPTGVAGTEDPQAEAQRVARAQLMVQAERRARARARALAAVAEAEAGQKIANGTHRDMGPDAVLASPLSDAPGSPDATMEAATDGQSQADVAAAIAATLADIHARAEGDSAAELAAVQAEAAELEAQLAAAQAAAMAPASASAPTMPAAEGAINPAAPKKKLKKRKRPGPPAGVAG